MDRIADELEALRAEQQALRALVEEQRALIDRLSDAAATRPGAAPAPPATADATRDEDDLPDRRRFFARAAAAGVAGAAGIVVGADRAAAADGDPVLIGRLVDTEGTSPTVLSYSNIGNATATTSEINQQDARGVALAGLTIGRKGIGVYGYSAANDDDGTGAVGAGSEAAAAGVYGLSNAGPGGVFEGGRANMRLVPTIATGAPTSGNHLVGDVVLDAEGDLFVCVSAGDPGEFRQVFLHDGASLPATPRTVFSSPVDGGTAEAGTLFVDDVNGDATDSFEDATVSTWAVAKSAVGLYAYADPAGVGGTGRAATGLRSAIYSLTSDGAYSLELENASVGESGAPMRIVPYGSGPPPGNGHRIGEVTVSQSGDMYLCTTLDGGDPRWQRLSGPDFVVLPSPQRAYDSRPGQSPTSGSQTPLAAQGNRIIDLTTETDLPDDAVAALLNVTITNTTGAGFVSFYSAGEADKPAGFAGFASVNSTGAGQTIGNNVTTGLDDGALKIYASRATDIVIDVVAYHRGPIDSTRGLG